MSQQLISRSPDLKRLRDEGYDVSVVAGHLVVRHVPYVTASQEVKYGVLVSELTLGDTTMRPSDHVAMFSGETPCDRDGTPLSKILNASRRRELAPGLSIDHTFSSKPAAGYNDYYEKVTTYVRIVASPAMALDDTATATPFPVIEDDDEDPVFKYIDTASSRAGIAAVGEKLRIGKVAIVGVGGTGAYVLDLVAKSPVREIHLFDADLFLQHNAFRSPGASSLEELAERVPKVEYFRRMYSAQRHGIIAHPYALTDVNAAELEAMDFAFVCIDTGTAKEPLVKHLEQAQVPFIDVGMGVEEVDGSLAGIVRVTTSTPAQRDHVRARGRISFSDAGEDAYARNIQIADLNALNAALAVVKWKKLLGFYRDLENEHFSAYTTDGNHLINEDRG
jgi:hypothetical protein